MKPWNRDDKMAQLAFGELNVEQARQLEQEVSKNPEAARRLNEYREIKDGLKLLSDIPEDQLSRERLREAILNGGLHAEPAKTPWWTNVWMPSATVAVVALVFFVRSSTQKPVAPELKLDMSKVAMNLGTADFSHEFTSDAKPKVEEAMRSPEPVATVAATHPSVGVTKKSNRHNYYASRNLAKRSSNQKSIVRSQATNELIAAIESNSIAMTPAGLTSKSRDLQSQSNGPIILIDEEKDSNTGTQRATEVSSASNVVVGG